MKSRRLVLVIGLIFCGVLILAVLLLPSSKPSGPGVPREPELGGPASVSIDNTERLSQLLLYNQFVTLKDALSSYILSETKGKASTAEILLRTTLLNNDGSISFSMKYEGLDKVLGVVVQRPNISELIFSVPEKNYQITLYPYGQ